MLVSTPKTPSNEKYDLDDIIRRLLAARKQRVTKSLCLKNWEITSICHSAREVIMEQPVLLELNPPVNIVGDIHGQYEDLLRIFDLCGHPPAANYLFLGDYVDRGKQSLETILLLFCYKIKYPEIFCVHGGLSPYLTSMDEIRAIQRPTDVPDSGLLNDLLWSDPSETTAEWEDNERGVSFCESSYVVGAEFIGKDILLSFIVAFDICIIVVSPIGFGKAIVRQFLDKFDFDLVTRAHMVVESGYEFFSERQLVTVFSAPNYCGEFDNKAAVAKNCSLFLFAVTAINRRISNTLSVIKEILEPQFTKEVDEQQKMRRRLSPPVLK
ncbi:hypothetical protein HDU76_007825 [Blyttiomyces sp. JEL0837]|nr:hypothetical protein HDU76_007825 [Blyttiomyces sp. JEL0837]